MQLYPLYDTLVDYDFDTLAARPGLATSWSFPTPTTMVLELRSGVTFHDGTPIQRRCGEVQPGPQPNASALQHPRRHCLDRQRRDHRSEPSDAAPEAAGYGVAADPGGPRGNDGVAGRHEEVRRRFRPQPGRHRHDEVRRVARQGTHRLHAQRKLLEAQSPLYRRHALRADSGIADGIALGHHRRERFHPRPAAAAAGGGQARQRARDAGDADTGLPIVLPQFRPRSAGRPAGAPGAQPRRRQPRIRQGVGARPFRDRRHAAAEGALGVRPGTGEPLSARPGQGAPVAGRRRAPGRHRL